MQRADQIRYVVVRPGRPPERVTYPHREIAERWAGPAERVVPVRVVPVGPFRDCVEPLDDEGAAALEGVFFVEGTDA